MVKCFSLECNKRASFGLSGGKSEYCVTHKIEEMIDLVSKQCLFSSCVKQPNYGLPGQKRKYCSDHKTGEMVNVVSKTCLVSSCNTISNYGLPGQKRNYCSKHKTGEMVNVVSKTCLVSSCNIRPHYGIPGKKPEYCVSHKSNNMENIISKLCFFENCNKQPIYGLQLERQYYCAKHKSDIMTDLKHKKCTSCGIFTVFKKNNFLCSYCSPNKTQKTKEMVIKNLLEEYNYKFIHNKEIGNDSCNKYRPDFLFDCDSYFVILECDENAHEHYDKECEFIRMNNIISDLGLPTLFIRYNPDLKGISKNVKHKTLLENLEKHLYKESNLQIEPFKKPL